MKPSPLPSNPSTPVTKPGTVNPNRGFCTVVRTRMNTHSLVMAAEVDAADHVRRGRGIPRPTLAWPSMALMLVPVQNLFKNTKASSLFLVCAHVPMTLSLCRLLPVPLPYSGGNFRWVKFLLKVYFHGLIFVVCPEHAITVAYCLATI